MIRFYRRVIVPVPGTPVRVTAAEVNPDQPTIGNVHGVLIQALKGNAGAVYIGTSTMVKATEDQVFATLAIPTVNNIPTFSAALTMSPAGIALKDFWIDADLANEGVHVTILVT